MIEAKLQETLNQIAQNKAVQVTVLTGAGVSAESGIPTFRGAEGYWTVGSKEYQPHEIGTNRMFQQHPDAVWLWYLYRRGVCHQAEPNPGHLALARLEAHFTDRFTLITQNVDNLHLRAGNSVRRTYEVHGNINTMRCINTSCPQPLWPIPDDMPVKSRESSLSEAERALLRCGRCQSPTRPHILWFDEFYNEEYYRFYTSLEVATQTDLLIVVGTSGSTNLPHHVVNLTLKGEGIVVDINLNPNVFTEMALRAGGYAVPQPSGQVLPALVDLLCQ